MILLKAHIQLDIPTKIAVCPICKSKLVCDFGHWTETDKGMQAAEVCLNCVSEPFDFDSYEWEVWFKRHWSQPYVDWLPVEQVVLKWVNKHYVFNV